jgi:hypothetical protein
MAACKVVPAGGMMIKGVSAGTAAVQWCLTGCEQEQNNRLPAMTRKGSVLKEYIFCMKIREEIELKAVVMIVKFTAPVFGRWGPPHRWTPSFIRPLLIR